VNTLLFGSLSSNVMYWHEKLRYSIDTCRQTKTLHRSSPKRLAKPKHDKQWYRATINCVTKNIAPTSTTSSVPENAIPTHTNPTTAVSRPTRIRNKRSWLDDYVTEDVHSNQL